MKGHMGFFVYLRGGGEVRLEGDYVTYWAGEGLPTYEGPIDGLEQAHHEVLAELVERKAVKVTGE